MARFKPVFGDLIATTSKQREKCRLSLFVVLCFVEVAHCLSLYVVLFFPLSVYMYTCNYPLVRLCVFPLLFCLVYCLFVCLSIPVYPFVCLIIHLSVFNCVFLFMRLTRSVVCLPVSLGFFYCFTCNFTINLFVWIFSCFHLLVC